MVKLDGAEDIAQIVILIASGTLTLFIKAFRKWIIEHIRYVLRIRPPEDPTDRIKTEIKVYDILTETRVTCKGSRCYLIQFHNGDEFSSERPIWKVTCTHESVDRGISHARSEELKNAVSSYILDELKPMFNVASEGVKKASIVGSCGDCDKRGTFVFNEPMMNMSIPKSLMVARGTSIMFTSPVVIKNKIVGYVGVDTGEEGDERNACKVCEAASQISLLLKRK